MSRNLALLKKAVTAHDERAELEVIVRRLKGGADERVKHEPSSRVAAIARNFRGDSEIHAESPDLEKADVRAIKTGPLSLPAAFYRAFASPLNAFARVLAGTPWFQDARVNLDCAGVVLSVEAYLALSASAAVLLGLTVFALFAVLGFALGDLTLVAFAPVLGLLGLGSAVAFAAVYPSSKAEGRAREVDRVLPFALRQLATQIKAGVSFYSALRSVAQTDYGVLSDEFKRVLSDMANGVSTDEALARLLKRTRSKGLRTALTQVIRALKTGGSLSQIITDIADDVSFESRMRIRDFTERLNFINIIYIMVAVVAPVGAAILSAVMQIPMFSGGLPPFFVYFAFAGVTVAMLLILYITKRLEPVAW
ncbi:MAG: type II secretion system F family protein [Candidatus Micrarchaeia archaeon]